MKGKKQEAEERKRTRKRGGKLNGEEKEINGRKRLRKRAKERVQEQKTQRAKRQIKKQICHFTLNYRNPIPSAQIYYHP